MRRFVLFLLGVFAFACPPVWAQPSGQFQFPNQGGLQSTRAIWDVSGSYRISFPIQGLGDLSFDLPLVQDVKGKITGPTAILIKAGTNDLQCTAKVRGAASGPSQDFNVSVSVTLSGSGVLQGQVRKFKGSLTLTLKVDPITSHLVGTVSGSGSVAGGGSGSTSQPVAYPLPTGMNGGWSLTLNLQNAGAKLAGDASLVLSNGRTLPFTLSGSVSSKDGTTNLKLSGSNSAAGAKFGVGLQGTPATLVTVSGAVLGASLK